MEVKGAQEGRFPKPKTLRPEIHPLEITGEYTSERSGKLHFSLLTAHMGDCQNYGLFLGTLHIRCRIIIGIQKGTIILTTTRIL